MIEYGRMLPCTPLRTGCCSKAVFRTQLDFPVAAHGVALPTLVKYDQSKGSLSIMIRAVMGSSRL
jgi:hypothetical protein